MFSDDLNRRQQLSNDKKLLGLGPGLKRNSREWTLLRKLQPDELAYYAITCEYCAPDIRNFVREKKRHLWLGQQSLELANLNPDCIFCNTVQRVYDHFFNDPAVVTVSSEYPTAHKPLKLIFSTLSNERSVVYLYSRDSYISKKPFPFAVQDVCLDPTSDALVQKVDKWIQECIASHDTCGRAQLGSLSLPKRLLRLDGQVRLYTPSQPVRYTALSYCWGGYDQHQTQRSNVASRYKSLEPSELPQTIKDAILFSRKLGIAYIWIDALCIVQDDHEEWADEATKMADVYSGAHVVIAATRAANVTEGFLQHHREPLEIASQPGAKAAWKVQARRTDIHGDSDGVQFQRLPLSQRGWCLQEGLLASRTVHFSPYEVYFVCKLTASCECGLTDRDDGMRYNRSWPPPHHVKGIDYKDFSPGSWLAVTKDCSKRSFTFPDDILPALSGLARRTVPLCPGTYIAGMWEVGIAGQLGWTVVEPWKIRAFDMRRVVTRPTFSWITSPGAVEYDVSYDSTPLCTFVSAQVIPATSDPFGKISFASITLRGHSAPAVELAAILQSKSGGDPYGPFGSATLTTDRGLRFSVRDDQINTGENRTLVSILDWSSMICFALYVEPWGDMDVLLLQHSPQDDAYIRVGVSRDIPKTWFDSHATECNVTIV